MKEIFLKVRHPWPKYEFQQDSLHSFLKMIEVAKNILPKNKKYCFGDANGSAKRNEYNWLLYSLAPRIIIPTNYNLNEEDRGLSIVAPSLLWSNESIFKCDFIISIPEMEIKDPFNLTDHYIFYNKEFNMLVYENE